MWSGETNSGITVKKRGKSDSGREGGLQRCDSFQNPNSGGARNESMERASSWITNRGVSRRSNRIRESKTGIWPEEAELRGIRLKEKMRPLAQNLLN